MERRRQVVAAASAAVGGASWTLVPALDPTIAGALDYAWLPAILLLGAIYGLPAGLPSLRESPGRTGLGLVGGGLAFVAVGAGVRLWALSLPPPRIGVVIALILAGIGLLVAAFGSAVVGVVLFRQRSVPRLVAAAFAVTLPLDPVLTALVRPSLGVGVSLYGVAWILLGVTVARSPRGSASD